MMIDIAIIGAGPYGLAAAAHLRTIRGMETRVFGEPMSFWSGNMPRGMYLRSNWTATHIASPDHSLTLETYQSETGIRIPRPIPLDIFVQYGLWYYAKGIADVDRRTVIRVDRESSGFRLSLEDGSALHSRRVVIAAGIGAFAWRPPQLAALPRSLASHTCDHNDLSEFAGRSVLVVGGGQSALESAALLHEGGAQVEVVARTHHIHWLQGAMSRALHRRIGRWLYAPTDVGPAGISQLVSRPELLNKLPRPLQTRLWKRCIRSAGSRWLVNRLKPVPLTLGRSIQTALEKGGHVEVTLDDGSHRTADHILLGTGYRVNIVRYPFLSPVLVARIESVNGYPCLGPGLESSIPGLHFLGAPAAWSFGPLMQFVSGTRYASQALVKSAARKCS